MSNISVRLPPEIERGLEEEARLTERNRSDLLREAVGEYLTRKQKARLIAEMKAAARALYSNAETAHEAAETAEAGLDDWLDSIAHEEQAAGVDPDERWWD
jgi:predicted transcriptional regulator